MRDRNTQGLGTAAFILGMQLQVLGKWQEMADHAQTDPECHCLLQTDGLMTGVQHGLVGLNQILSNRNHNTKKKPKVIQLNPASAVAVTEQSD